MSVHGKRRIYLGVAFFMTFLLQTALASEPAPLPEDLFPPLDQPGTDIPWYDRLDHLDNPTFDSPSGAFQNVGGRIRPTAYYDLILAPQEERPSSPRQPLETSSSGGGWVPISLVLDRQVEEQITDETDSTGPVEIVPTTGPIAPRSLPEMMRESSNVLSVAVRHNSPVSLAPNIRGFKAGQVYSQVNGVYWVPARQDLDTMLSKIDPGMVRTAVITPGPYAVKYGPGFSFINVIREPTPRYENGCENHFRTSGNVRTNGGQFYGRETVFGGGPDWGYRFSYGHRRGSDYEAGNDQPIPSSYHNRDIWGELGFDLNPYQRVEFTYQRLDQTDTEYAGQFFDIDFLATYGFELRVIDEDPRGPWSKCTVETWYNRTRFAGDTSGKRNPSFPVIPRVERALDDEASQDPGLPQGPYTLFATTGGGVASTGARVAVTFGDTDDVHLNAGADLRYLRQNIEEDFLMNNANGLSRFRTNMPRCWLTNPGVYAELCWPRTERWKATVGTRLDFLSTTARASDLRGNSMLPGGANDLKQDDLLYAFYLSNEWKLNPCWTMRLDMGHAQRPPTLIERYADGLFLGIVQSGFSRVIGDPRLDKGRNWQIDLSLQTEHENWRASAGLFYAWVVDYITLEDDTVIDFADARLLRYTNTDLATLAGFELGASYDLLPCLSLFGTMRYVEGEDRELNGPLPAIPPLDSTLGLRLHDLEGGRRWGIECAARVVDDQDRAGVIRLQGQPATLEEVTPGFTVWHLHGYYNCTDRLSLVAGIDNLFDTNYQEHLDLRLLGPPGFGPASRVYAPGLTPFVAVDWLF